MAQHSSHHGILPKVMGIWNWHNPYQSSLLSSDFHLGILPCRPSCRLMVESEIMTFACDLQFTGFSYKHFCELLERLLLCCSALWVNPASWPGPGTFTTVKCYDHLWIRSLTVVHWTLEMGSKPFPHWSGTPYLLSNFFEISEWCLVLQDLWESLTFAKDHAGLEPHLHHFILTTSV